MDRVSRFTSRHERHAHPKPVLTCPLCIWRIAGDIVWRKANR